jgi:microcompartment protein CcmK/EutM
MRICRVVGKAQATVKHPSLEGTRLLAVRDLDGNGKATGTPYLAVDATGAGSGEVVAVVTGSAAARVLPDRDSAVDASIVAILDLIFIDGKEAYTRKEEKS